MPLTAYLKLMCKSAILEDIKKSKDTASYLDVGGHTLNYEENPRNIKAEMG